MLIHLIRHTTPDVKQGICYGQTDLKLTSNFEQEKDTILKKLKPHYDTVYSSPLTRCLQLARTLETDHFLIEKNLLEVNFGDWEGRKWDDIPQSASQQWMDDFINIAPPNGESLLEMQQRVNRFIQQYINPKENNNIAIVTHAGVIRLFLAWALNVPLKNIFQIKLSYGAILEMDYVSDDFGAAVTFLS